MGVLMKLIAFINALTVSCALNEIPPFMQICHRSDPAFNECLKQSVEALRPQLINGNPEYNIPSVEPIIIDDLIKDTTGPLKIQTSQFIAYGGGSFEVIDIISHLDTLDFDIDIHVPNLKIDAKYHVDGKLMMLPIRGNGSFQGNLTDCRATAHLHAEEVERNGDIYLNLSKLEMKFTVGGGTVLLDNLFNGDKTITKMVNDAINDNLHLFFNDLLPYIEKALGVNFLNTGNQIIAPYTYAQLLPE